MSTLIEQENPSVWMTEAEYLGLLAASDRKWEFYPERQQRNCNGEQWGEAVALWGMVVAMAGGSRRHNDIGFNISGNLFNKLKGTNCRGKGPDTAVGEATAGGYYFPDASIVCGKGTYRDHAKIEVLTNPTVVFEVESKSSAKIDRTEKVSRYTSMPSVKLYVILEQDEVEVDLLIRTSHNEWAMRNLKGLDAEFEVDPPGITLTLAELYEDVELA